SPYGHCTTGDLDDDIPVNAVRDTTAVSALSTPRPMTSPQRSTTEQDIRLCARPQTHPRAEAPDPSAASPRPGPSVPPHWRLWPWRSAHPRPRLRPPTSCHRHKPKPKSSSKTDMRKTPAG